MRRFARLILPGLCAFTLGCGTLHFETLPTAPEEFELSLEELQERHPDVPVQKTVFLFQRPAVDALSEAWGEPDSKEVQKWYFPAMGGTLVALAFLTDPAATILTAGTVLLVSPDSPRDYIWHKGSYCIVAVVDRTFPTYKALVAQWDWTHLRTADDVPYICRQFRAADRSAPSSPSPDAE